MAKRFRTKLIHIYLHEVEDKFLKSYADKNLATVSELFRGWLHEVMKREGYEIKEPSLPESKNKKEGGFNSLKQPHFNLFHSK